MGEWKEVRLEDILLIPSRNGLTKPSNIRGSGVKMIAMGELFGNPIIRDIQMERVPVTEKEFLSSSIETNDLLFARQSLTLEGAGKCSIVKEVNEPTVFESHLIRIRIDDQKASPWYIYYYFNSYFGKHLIQNIVNQVAAAGIKGSDLVKLSIKLPPLNEQRRIASILLSFDDKISTNRRICANLEEQAQALFKNWFVDFAPFKDGEFVESELGRIPEGWRVGKLEDVAEVTMGQSPSGTSYNENGIGTVFYQGRTDFGFRFPTNRVFTTEPKRFAEPLSVLLSVRAPVGDINVANERCCIGRGLASIQAKNKFDSFLLYLMRNLRKQFDIYNGEGTVFGCINKDALKGMKIVLPAEIEIKRFNDSIKSFDEQIFALEQESARLVELRDALLPRLMSGEIKV